MLWQITSQQLAFSRKGHHMQVEAVFQMIQKALRCHLWWLQDMYTKNHHRLLWLPWENIIDTDVEVAVISEQLYRRMKAPTLQDPKMILKTPGESKLNMQKKILATLKFGERTTFQEVYIIDGLCTALLGCPAIWKLFQGLTKLKGEYPIKPIPNINIFAFCQQPPSLNYPGWKQRSVSWSRWLSFPD